MVEQVYKLVITVTVLTTEQGLARQDLSYILGEINDGESIGDIRTTSNAPVPPEQLRAELFAIGDDGTFFDT
jgi:hypothetical protein